MKAALYAKKLGMFSFFQEDKTIVPVTVLEGLLCKIIRKKSIESDGYNSVMVNFGGKAKKISKAEKGVLSGVSIPQKYIREMKFLEDVYSSLEIGDELSLNRFENIEFVDIVGDSIGKGFAGVMKRHNFAGLEASHGVSIAHRSGGSTGGCQDPGKVFKGKKMAGQLGNERVTIQNLKVIKLDLEKKIFFVKGSVPGSKGKIVLIRNSKKKN